jgi:hypothetical protein
MDYQVVLAPGARQDVREDYDFGKMKGERNPYRKGRQQRLSHKLKADILRIKLPPSKPVKLIKKS